MDYTLYKGAWVASDVFHEEELSRAACVNLLKTGGGNCAQCVRL